MYIQLGLVLLDMEGAVKPNCSKVITSPSFPACKRIHTSSAVFVWVPGLGIREVWFPLRGACM